jgi:hypothetical protein
MNLSVFDVVSGHVSCSMGASEGSLGIGRACRYAVPSSRVHALVIWQVRKSACTQSCVCKWNTVEVVILQIAG